MLNCHLLPSDKIVLSYLLTKKGVMKRVFTFLLLLTFALGVSAQLTKTVNFELETDDDLWTIFANGTDSPDDITIVENPNYNDVNSSDKVLEFKVNAAASPWAGAWTESFGPMEFTEDAHTLTMMVLKTIISPSALKFEGSTDGGQVQELKVENTLTDEWELMTFEIPAAVGFTYNRLVLFPDFPEARTEASIVYIDNITSETAVTVKNLKGSAIKTYPNPVDDVMYIQHPEMRSITISNLAGKALRNFTFPTASTKTIALNDLDPGLYLVMVNSTSGKFVSKFSKR
jgi:hypothetical protein